MKINKNKRATRDELVARTNLKITTDTWSNRLCLQKL